MASVDGDSTTEQKSAHSAASSDRIVVVDCGKHKPKQVKRLRKGRGKLMDRVRETVAELESDGTVSPGANTVVLVVERRARQRKTIPLFLSDLS